MNLTERIPTDRLELLNRITLDFYSNHIVDKSKKYTKKDRESHFNKIKKYISNNIKTKGETLCLYHQSNNMKDGEHGRLFSNESIQQLDGAIRGYLFNGITTDIDCKNCHPTLLEYICKKHNIKCYKLTEYVNNVDIYKEEIPDCKMAIIRMINNKKKCYHKNDFLNELDKQIKSIQKELIKIDEYKRMFESAVDNKEDNIEGSFINRVLCHYENKVLMVMVEFLTKNNIEITTLMYDGLMIYGDINDELLTEMEDEIYTKIGVNIELTTKEHSKVITDECLEELDEVEEYDKDKSFESMRDVFEKNHCKIVNKALFIKETGDRNIIMTRKQMRDAYEHLQHNELKDGKVIFKSFIEKWFSTNSIRRYDDVGIYPTGLKCPDNIYNLWTPFDMEKIDTYEKKDISLILSHIKLLCGNNDEVYDYMIKWIAQMIQYPYVKSICPTLISREGAGKGRFIELLRKMMGKSKVYETSSPSRDVWGNFNGVMSDTYLVNLNELSKKDTLESEGRIKALITDPTISINKKGVDTYEIPSHHHFIITTNSEEPINTRQDDRRNLIIRSSDEKIGDEEYFKTLVEMMNDIDVIKSCYEYFKSIPDMNNFCKLELPVTEYHSELKQLSLTPIELFIRHYVENAMKDEFDIRTADLYEEFKGYVFENKINYTLTSNQFAVRLNRQFGQMGITTIHTKNGNNKHFDIPLLKKKLGLGCLIDDE